MIVEAVLGQDRPDIAVKRYRFGAPRPRRWERAMGHSGYVEDELGATVLAARITRDIMRLAFQMERQYAPDNPTGSQRPYGNNLDLLYLWASFSGASIAGSAGK